MAESADLLGSTAIVCPSTGEEDARGLTGPIIDLQDFTRRARARFGERITYHRVWQACASGLLPAKRLGSHWVLEVAALDLVPAALKLPITPDAA